MDILSTWVLKFFTAHFLSVAYFSTGIAFAFLYIPQITRLLKDKTGASAISLFSSTTMMLFRTIPFLYVLAVTKDWIMAIVIFLDWFGRLIVTSIATYKRYTYQPESIVIEVITKESDDFIELKVVSPAETQLS